MIFQEELDLNLIKIPTGVTDDVGLPSVPADSLPAGPSKAKGMKKGDFQKSSKEN